MTRCAECGTSQYEVNQRERDDAWVCRRCFIADQESVAESTPIEPVRPIEPVSNPTYTLSVVGSKNGSMGVTDGSMGLDETQARVKALGITAPLQEKFACILPGHDHEARVHPTGRKFWHYECDDVDLGLAEVRACIAYGTVKRISPVEAARWRERLDYEAGLLEPQPVPVDVTGSDVTVRVANGLRLFLGLRDARWTGQPFTWAREFVMAWCGVSDQQARDAVFELRETYKVLVPTGDKRGRAIEYDFIADSVRLAVAA